MSKVDEHFREAGFFALKCGLGILGLAVLVQTGDAMIRKYAFNNAGHRIADTFNRGSADFIDHGTTYRIVVQPDTKSSSEQDNCKVFELHRPVKILGNSSVNYESKAAFSFRVCG